MVSVYHHLNSSTGTAVKSSVTNTNIIVSIIFITFKTCLYWLLTRQVTQLTQKGRVTYAALSFFSEWYKNIVEDFVLFIIYYYIYYRIYIAHKFKRARVIGADVNRR